MAQFNVEVMATSASSFWSNGICERNHAVVDRTVQKILEEEPKIDIEFALATLNAVSAKNCLTNHNGFAPVQLVTGQLPNLPTVFNSGLPALEQPESENNMRYIQTMNIARQAYIKAESSERIKCALRHPVKSI